MKNTARRSVPRTAETRVRWILKFATTPPPLSASSARWRNTAGAMLAALSGYPPGAPPPPDLVDEAHARLQQCLVALANGLQCGVYVPEAVWTLYPPPRRQAGTRSSSPIVREWNAAAQGWKHLPTVVISKLVDDLNAIGADRLRACPLERDGKRCGAIFLASRRQTYCSVPHAQTAAWQRYQLGEAQKDWTRSQRKEHLS